MMTTQIIDLLQAQMRQSGKRVLALRHAGKSLPAVSVDDAVSDAVIGEIAALDGVEDVRRV